MVQGPPVWLLLLRLPTLPLLHAHLLARNAAIVVCPRCLRFPILRFKQQLDPRDPALFGTTADACSGSAQLHYAVLSW